VTIPQRLRKKYRIDSSADVEFIEEDGEILLRARRRSEAPIRKLLGRAEVRLSTEEILRLTRAG
jgi:bifunctional DNA-binding transcriptional regulator/antitoxin component of YhaV-PrlF toxin-antitoxin module